MFAYHAGIIDSGVPTGRIIHDRHSAYALLLGDLDELDSPDPNKFTYRAKPGEIGRYRLTAATPVNRQPVRVLRSHSLRSFWSPRAGIRYDGLHVVSGWGIRFYPLTKAITYDIHFKRLPSETPMGEVITHPTAEEIDDYMEYKRIRHTTRQTMNKFHRARPLADTPSPAPAVPSITLGLGPSNSLTVEPPTPGGVSVQMISPRKTLSSRPTPKSRLRIQLPDPPRILVEEDRAAKERMSEISGILAFGQESGAGGSGPTPSPRTARTPLVLGLKHLAVKVATPIRGTSPGPGAEGGDYFGFGGSEGQ